MSEALWYSSYQSVRTGRSRKDPGAPEYLRPPKMARLSRRPKQEQWEATITLAIGIAEGSVSFRNVSIASTGELYCYWGNNPTRTAAGVETSWWFIAPRVLWRAQKIVDAATATAARQPGGARPDAVVRVLRAWQRTRQWRRYAVRIMPRRPPQPQATRRRRRNSGPLPLPSWRRMRDDALAARDDRMGYVVARLPRYAVLAVCRALDIHEMRLFRVPPELHDELRWDYPGVELEDLVIEYDARRKVPEDVLAEKMGALLGAPVSVYPRGHYRVIAARSGYEIYGGEILYEKEMD